MRVGSVGTSPKAKLTHGHTLCHFVVGSIISFPEEFHDFWPCAMAASRPTAATLGPGGSVQVKGLLHIAGLDTI